MPDEDLHLADLARSQAHTPGFTRARLYARRVEAFVRPRR
jgi:hypothetical protein